MKKILAYCSAMAREDAQLEKHRQEAEQRLLSEILRIRSTVSWRITAPLRVIWNMYVKLVRKSGNDGGSSR